MIVFRYDAIDGRCHNYALWVAVIDAGGKILMNLCKIQFVLNQ